MVAVVLVNVRTKAIRDNLSPVVEEGGWWTGGLECGWG